MTTLGYSPFGEKARAADMTRLLAQLFIGIEVEMHRVDQQGRLSQRLYPNTLGDPNTHKSIKNDFAQSQMEVITPRSLELGHEMDFLTANFQVIRENIASDELIWLYSMPPRLDDKTFGVKLPDLADEEAAYRERVLANRTMASSIISGVHINLGMQEETLTYIFKRFFVNDYPDEATFRNELYIKVAQGFLYYQWVITLLSGATPVAAPGFFKDDERPARAMRSIRMASRYGFGNPYQGDYSNVENSI